MILRPFKTILIPLCVYTWSLSLCITAYATPTYHNSDDAIKNLVLERRAGGNKAIDDVNHAMSVQSAWMSFDLPAHGSSVRGQVFVFLNLQQDEAEFLLIRGDDWFYANAPIDDPRQPGMDGEILGEKEKLLWYGFNHIYVELTLHPILEISPHRVVIDSSESRKLVLDALKVNRPGEEIKITEFGTITEVPRVQILSRDQIPYPWKDTLSADAFAIEMTTQAHGQQEETQDKLIIFGVENESPFSREDRAFALLEAGDDFTDEDQTESRLMSADEALYDRDAQLRAWVFEYIQKSATGTYDGTALEYVQTHAPELISSEDERSIFFDESGSYTHKILAMLPWMQTHSEEANSRPFSGKHVDEVFAVRADMFNTDFNLYFFSDGFDEVSLRVHRTRHLRKLEYVRPTSERIVLIDSPSQWWETDQSRSSVFRAIFPEPGVRGTVVSDTRDFRPDKPLSLSEMTGRLAQKHSLFTVEGVNFLLIHPSARRADAHLFLIIPSRPRQYILNSLNEDEPMYEPHDVHRRQMGVSTDEFNAMNPFRDFEREVLSHITAEKLLKWTSVNEGIAQSADVTRIQSTRIQSARIQREIEAHFRSNHMALIHEVFLEFFQSRHLPVTDEIIDYYKRQFVEKYAAFLMTEAKLLRELRFVELPIKDGEFTPEMARTVQLQAEVFGQRMSLRIPHGVHQDRVLAIGAIRVPRAGVPGSFDTQSFEFSVHSDALPYPLFGLQHMIRGPQVLRKHLGFRREDYSNGLGIPTEVVLNMRIYAVEHIIYHLQDETLKPLDGIAFKSRVVPFILSSLRLLVLKLQGNPLLAEAVKLLIHREGGSAFMGLRILFPSLAGVTDKQIMETLMNRLLGNPSNVSDVNIDARVMRALNLSQYDIAHIEKSIEGTDSKTFFKNVLATFPTPQSLPDPRCE